jgi:hypothetical protein
LFYIIFLSVAYELTYKVCKFDSSRRCCHSCCTIFCMSSGNVDVCPLHLNPFGFMMPRKVGIILRCMWNKHLRGGSHG